MALDAATWELVMALLAGTENPRLLARQFTSDQYRQMVKKGEAMPDGSFPIQNRLDLIIAIQAIERAERPASKVHIKKRARALKLTELIPAGW